MILINNAEALFSSLERRAFYRDDVPRYFAGMIDEGYEVWVRDSRSSLEFPFVPAWMQEHFLFLDRVSEEMIDSLDKADESFTVDLDNDTVSCCGPCYDSETVFGPRNYGHSIDSLVESLGVDLALIVTDNHDLRVEDAAADIKRPGEDFDTYSDEIASSFSRNVTFVVLRDSDTQTVPRSVPQINWVF